MASQVQRFSNGRWALIKGAFCIPAQLAINCRLVPNIEPDVLELCV